MHTTQAGTVARPKLPPALLTQEGLIKVATAAGLDAWRRLRPRGENQADLFVYADEHCGKFWIAGAAK